jgi:alpha-1,3/alpha-1,6-mannosyltransferase
MTNPPPTLSDKPFHVVFIHLDLGIGGAEQLVLQLATASQDLHHKVDIVTTRCDPDHCFAQVKPPNGRLSHNVHRTGTWIPANLLGGLTAFCSTLRMIWLTLMVTIQFRQADVIVVDVLPTAIPILTKWLPQSRVLFYCHFPDKLLLRTPGGRLKKAYRSILDALEETTMACSDTLVVNSKFTLTQVERVFPSLHSHNIGVLYPALDISNMTQALDQPKTSQSPIVSLNRFERKKNIGLLIQAYAELQTAPRGKNLPPLIIAGGYDTQSVENVEYRGELGQLAKQLGVACEFRCDITDSERATLFQTALCVVYTPDKEHFGIVPLEAMYAGTPVVAVNSGGPMETVVDGVTGYLRAPTASAFAGALQQLLDHTDQATKMGQAGRSHVEHTFGPDRFQEEWKDLMQKTKQQKRQNASSETYRLWSHVPLYLFEAFMALSVVLLLTHLLRLVGILGPTQSIFGGVRSNLLGDEL